jgi:IcmF-related N-terminal domain
MALLTTIWNGVRQLLGLVMPFFAKAGDWRRFAPAIIWTLRILVLAIFLGVLYYVHQHFDLARVLPRTSSDFLHQFWLPLLGLLFVVMCWLGWWVWQLLRPEEDQSVFPDIDEAWEEAVDALHRAGVDLTTVPVFLTIGRPAGLEDTMFAAAELRLAVRQTPSGGTAPLHVYGFRDGRHDSVFITCAGASLLGKYVAILTGEEAPADVAQPGGEGASQASIDLSKTARPEGEVRQLLEILREAKRQGRELTEEEQREILKLERKGRPALLKNVAEVETARARLMHLCRLIVRERRPYCPINGMLLVVPWECFDSEEDAAQTGTICQQDLSAAREVLQLNCPVFVLVSDLEKAPGGTEFIERFPRDRLKQRLGQRFPLMPDLDNAKVLNSIEDSARWICEAMFPTWIFKFLRTEVPDKDPPGTVVRGNAQLIKLLCQMKWRSKRLGQILTRGLVREEGGPLLFGGCYAAATGSNPGSEQAFLPGIFRRVIENQNYVSWTDEALAQDQNQKNLARYGYVVMAAAVVVAIGLGYVFRPWAH